MKSLCIKENNNEIIQFISNQLSKLGLKDFSISHRNFKIYHNTILHYQGEDFDLFYDKIASTLTNAILHFYQTRLLKRILEYNYFYFNPFEKKEMIEIAKSFLEEDFLSREDNYFSIYSAVLEYIHTNKSLVLEGFVNFRLSNYMKNLDYIIDLAVDKFITDKEYLEYVNMLKLYISLTPPKSALVHLVYLNRRKCFIRPR